LLPPPPPLPLPLPLPPPWQQQHQQQQQQGGSRASLPEHGTYGYLEPSQHQACSVDSLGWQGSGGSGRSITSAVALPADVHAMSAAAPAWLPDPWLQPVVGALSSNF
jgi:hypothetical protein